MLLVILTYKKPIEDVENGLPDHVLFLNKHYEDRKFIFSGHQNPRTNRFRRKKYYFCSVNKSHKSAFLAVL